MKKEGSLAREDAPKPAGKPSPDDFNDDDSYSLYFKGLMWKETTGFGVAIWGEEDDSLLFQMKRSLDDSFITVLEAELIALKRGLTEAASLGINHITIYCDDYRVLDLIMERSAPEQENIALIMDDVQRIRQQLPSSIAVLVTDQNQVKFAMDSINIRMPPSHKKTCGSCFDADGIKTELMLSSGLCRHQICVNCMKEHIEVRLQDGRSVPRCPRYGCISNLDLTSCAHLLTSKVQKMWERRIKQDSVPEWDRFHCPNTSCSAWMSRTKLFESTEEEGVRRCCFKCRKAFCIYCKVPWHSNLSCDEYKRSVPKPSIIVLRQCRSCQHTIELSEKRRDITCRCGYSFCFTCGAEWKLGGCSHHRQLDLILIGCFCYVFLVIVLAIYLLFITNT
ncbi:PREDICTED: putative E3 ubiquitin-protein ligase ARI4 [Camelina sativa]|uniref:RBR-type E3 ubiquitin transferase n=1 Tax=Camelina sativa TaxID=90675 RepID=A0ABM0TT93_CAMSA|nr:PREDICTED: putative E3 ubiquitin-protein ligase ARI4 [Camelina sativa]